MCDVAVRCRKVALIPHHWQVVNFRNDFSRLSNITGARQLALALIDYRLVGVADRRTISRGPYYRGNNGIKPCWNRNAALQRSMMLNLRT